MDSIIIILFSVFGIVVLFGIAGFAQMLRTQKQQQKQTSSF